MKYISKVIIVFFIIAFSFSILPKTKNIAIAAGTVSGAVSGTTAKAVTAENVKDVKGIIGKLLGFLQMASGLITILMIAFMGFNYIVGTPSVKEEMKKTALPILIGVILVFGATSIATFIIGTVE